jgi:hypothetical protein
VSGTVAAEILAAGGKDLKAVQSALDKEDPHAERGFAIPGLRLRLKTALEHHQKSDRNVLGILPGAEGSHEYVLVGAHYDHIGLGEVGRSMSSQEGQEGHEGPSVHNGADDNASGTSLLLELAASLAEQRKEHPGSIRRGVLLAFWSGEELGLVGSSYFAEHPTVPLADIVACLNFDMVGRLRDNRLMLQGAGSSPIWKRLIEKRNVAAGFSAVVQDDPYLPTDVTALYPRGLPVLNFFTGGHEQYHTPADDADTLNYEGLRRIAVLARGIVLDLAGAGERPEYARVERSDAGKGSRENLRVYLGTIPDYTGEVAGVKLTGVREGGPAAKAGLKGGDIIVEFGGQKIANIYDYTYALDAAKIGRPIEVVVLREGQRVTVTVTPEARK